jgi:hypothetical protein
MQRKSRRQNVVQARFDEIGQAFLFWFPVGLAFIGLMLHIFPKMAIQF